MDQKTKEIIIYTDGACSNKKIIKAGYGIYFPNNEFDNVSRSFTHTPITNQRAELYAIYKSLKIISNSKFINHKIHIYTDSMYSINSITIWIKDWKKNNWKNSKGKDVLNQDIIKNIDNLINENKLNIKFTHVRSHTNKSDVHSIGNSKADELAVNGIHKS